MIFANQVGLWALLALVPFILIYLIRPRPKEKVIPSLMFLMKKNQTFKQNAFLRKLLANVLFFIQLAALTLLALSIAAPFIDVPYSVASDNTIIILDSSASMQTKLGQTTRFDKALEIAKSSLSGKISIILAENIPLTILQEGDVFEAKILLSKLKPKATSTNLGDALLLAEDILKEKKGRIIVLSDFLQTEGSDILVVKRALTSRGNKIDFVEITGEAENIGIVDLELTKHTTKAYIKNFNNKEETIKVRLTKNKETLGEEELTLLPYSLESIVFDTPTETSKIELNIKDDLQIDNIAYISAPSKKQVDVLLITNKKKSSLIAALDASKDVKLSVSHPPLSHMVNNQQIKYKDFEIIIMADVGKEGETEGLLKGHFKDIDDYLKSGGKLIIAAQSDLGTIATTDVSQKVFWQLLPINIKSVGNRSRLCFDIFNQFTSQFEENNCPAVLEEFLEAEAKEGAVVIASANNNPIIAYKGDVFYYGIMDDKSDFKTLTSYPIFWNELINFLIRTENIDDYNFKGGDVIAVQEQEIKTPSSNIEASKLLLDEHGIYELENKKIAVNLLNEEESNVNKESELIEQDSSFTPGTETKMKKLELEIYLAVIVLIILFLEIFYLKQRGDL